MAQASFSASLNNCDSVQNWMIRSTGDNVNTSFSVNSTGQYEGDGALNLQFYGDSAGGHTAEVENSMIGSHDLTIYDEIRFNWFISDADLSAISSMRVRVGTSKAAYNSWDFTSSGFSALTNPVNSSWREVVLTGLVAAGASGTTDVSNINFLSIEFMHNAAFSAFTASGNVRLDNWRAIKHFDFVSDVELDSQGYMLRENSYLREDQPYSVDRFSTGDITYSNFDIYQFKAQTDWSGGWNDKYGIAENTFYDGIGLDISKVGEISNNYQAYNITSVANSGVVTAIQEYKQSAFFGFSNGANSARIYSWPGLGNTLTLQQTVAQSAIIDMIVYRNSLWVSYGAGTESSLGTLMFNGASWSAVTQSTSFFAELEDVLYTFDPSGQNFRSFDGTAWATEFSQVGWYIHRMVNWNSKIWYLASKPNFNYYNQAKSALFAYDGTDRITVQEFDDWCKNSLEVWNNKLWFNVGGILRSFDGEKIADELDLEDRFPRELSLDIFDNTYTTNNYLSVGKGIIAIGKKLFVAHNSGLSSGFQTTILTNSGGGFVRSHDVDEGQASSLGSFTFNRNKHLLLGTPQGGVLTEQLLGDNLTTSSSGDLYLNGEMISSWIDGDLFSVEKTFFSVVLNYKAFTSLYTKAFEAPSAFLVLYKLDNDDNTWSVLDNVNIGDVNTTSKELFFPANTVAKRIRVRILFGRGFYSPADMTSNDFFQGGSQIRVTLNNFTIKYLVSPDTKRKWNFDIILTDQILRNNNYRDTKDGEQLSATLWASRIKKRTLPFRDIDNSVYNVIVNDVKIQGPKVQTGLNAQGTGPEYVASIELLEG